MTIDTALILYHYYDGIVVLLVMNAGNRCALAHTVCLRVGIIAFSAVDCVDYGFNHFS